MVLSKTISLIRQPASDLCYHERRQELSRAEICLVNNGMRTVERKPHLSQTVFQGCKCDASARHRRAYGRRIDDDQCDDCFQEDPGLSPSREPQQ